MLAPMNDCDSANSVVLRLISGGTPAVLRGTGWCMDEERSRYSVRKSDIVAALCPKVGGLRATLTRADNTAAARRPMLPSTCSIEPCAGPGVVRYEPVAQQRSSHA